MAEGSITEKWLTLCSTWTVRVIFWVTTIFITYYCVQLDWVTVWAHVWFSTLSCAFLMVEAILVVSSDSLLATKLSKPARVRLHWILHIVALACVLFGLGSIMAHKVDVSYPQWVTFHGRLGLVAIILFVVVNISAIPTLQRKILPQFINFGSYKRFHIYFGLITFILLGISQITGVAKTWWEVQNIGGGTELSQQIVIAVYVIGGLLLVARPTYFTLKQTFGKSS